MAQIRDLQCCICFDPRTQGVVDCRRCVAFVCRTCITKLSATAPCPVCKNPRFVPSGPPPPPTIDSQADSLVRAVIEANLYRRYGSRAFGASVNISINWREPPPPPPAQPPRPPPAQRDPRAAEDVTPQPERPHQFRCGEYTARNRATNIQIQDRYRITKVNRSSIYFEKCGEVVQQRYHKRVKYDATKRKHYVPITTYYRLYDS